MHTVNPSFFDDPNLPKSNKKIWLKLEKGKTDLDHLAPQLRHEFYKVTKKPLKHKLRTYLVEDGYLYQMKSASKKKLSGVIDLAISRVSWKSLEDGSVIFKGLNCQLFGFRISMNTKSLEIYTKEDNIFETWKQMFIHKAILTNFHYEY